MTNQISTQTISFNNQSLITLEQNGTFYVAMRPICENIGLAWEAQLLRIKRDEILSQGMIVMIIPSNGGDQQMVCLPIEYLNGWLFGIDVKRCKPEIRETLIKYKKECYQALHDYWFKGKAERQIAPLAEERKFNLTHTNDDLKAIAWTWFEAYRMAAFLKRIEPALRTLQSPLAAEAYSMGHEYGWHIENTAKLIHRITQGVDYGNRPTPAVQLEKVLKPKPKAIKHYDF